MREFFIFENGSFKKVDSYRKGAWLNLVAPSEDEVRETALEFGIPMDFLLDPLDVDERARTETEEGVILIIVRIPFKEDGSSSVPFRTLPMGIILLDEGIITICSHDTRVIKDVLKGGVRVKGQSGKGLKLVLAIFLKVALLYLEYLKEINRRISEVETALHRAMRNEELIELLNIEKSLVFFTTSLKSNEIMMERLRRVELFKLGMEEDDMLEDVIVENKQAIEMANIYSNILSGTMDAFASIISNNLNVVMKFLTSITIVLMLPTLIASIYGMNIKLPFQDSPHAFLITMLISFFLTAGCVWIFVKRRWF